MQARGAPTLLAHRCSLCENFHTYIKCEVKTSWDMEMGHLWLKWVGQLWQSELLFLGDTLQKKKTLLFGGVPFPAELMPPPAHITLFTFLPHSGK